MPFVRSYALSQQKQNVRGWLGMTRHSRRLSTKSPTPKPFFFFSFFKDITSWKPPPSIYASPILSLSLRSRSLSTLLHHP